jgi:hypothetical protein
MLFAILILMLEYAIYAKCIKHIFYPNIWYSRFESIGVFIGWTAVNLLSIGLIMFGLNKL